MSWPSIPCCPSAKQSLRHSSPIAEVLTTCIPLRLDSPGSGCSTLLKVLSNNTEAYKSVEGTISYDGASPKEMAAHHSGDIAYLPEVSYACHCITLRC